MNISITKLGIPVSYDSFEDCKTKYKDKIGEEISGKQLMFLTNFCGRLPSLVKLPDNIPYEHPEIGGFVEIIKYASTEGKEISAEKAKKRLC